MTDAPVTVREIERKYELPRDGPPPALTGFAGVAEETEAAPVELEAVYYDTHDLRLLGDGVTLRRRTGGDDAGWHLKLPAGRDAREEVRLPPREYGEVPVELADLVRARTRGRGLGPVVRMHTMRHRRWLADADGRTLAEIATDQVTARTLDRDADDVCWGEIEVELVGGGREVLEAVDARLREAGAELAAQANKLERVLGDRLPVRTKPRPPAAGATAGEVVLAYLAAQVRAVLATDPNVRRDVPDAVHQFRVALRRTRSTFRTYRKLLDPDRTGALSAELSWLAGTLAGMRDGEVMAERLRGDLAELSAAGDLGPRAAQMSARVEAHFARTLARARADALRELDGPRYFAVLDDLDALLAGPPLTGRAGRTAGDVLPPLVGRAYDRLARAVARIDAAPDPAAADVATHDARKAAKRARYAAEAAEPVLGADARLLITRMKRLQDVLGEHQDAVVALPRIQEIAAEAQAAGEDTFAYGLLYARERRRAEEIRRDLPAAWRHADRDHPWAGG